MTRFLLAVTAALLLGACSDTAPTGGRTEPAAPTGPSFTSGDRWTIFGMQTPAQILDASPGWEVATRFTTSKAGCVVALRYYRAPGETGYNTVKLWTESGTLLSSNRFGSTSSGWKVVELRDHGVGPYVDLSVCIAPGTYRVSVNTNTKQAKTYGGLFTPIVSGPLTANAGFYGQPMGSMPTTHSGSSFFVDVVFEEN